MTRKRFIPFLAGAVVVPLAALGVVAGGSGANVSTPATAGAAKSHTGTVDVRTTSLGKILVNSKGHTLYLFKKDKGTKSACTGACAAAWPPLRTSGKPTAGSGAKASKIGTTKRSDGKPQVTYNRHPLYTFVKDTKAGQTNGEGLTAFGGSWFGLSPAGSQVSPHKSQPGGGGY